ncbi:ReoY family proteolytic degradation factor [Lentibacillus amyloliquefaciens]|uniref:UPF0302 protein AOX59_04625 n=1 Tax=Lentibacillus amyloliquefaciens TaxID=1472767 RepID=A0A0U4E4Z0_9BACI|nr:ReoY family proteolytic degradation factor [Lentibacillus amyloliquefaciens]ALX47953.1 hypothetical protein AOX59_04625 [Lentibacillus amyloliquefaciens]
MQTPVSAKDKKSFIQWFLNHYQLKKRESVWILNYIVNHQSLLSNVHFVREAKFCPRGLIMTAYCSDQVSFRFYKKQLVTTDAEKAFHEIRMNQEEPLYIQLNFNKSHQSSIYAAVLVENPFIPDDYFITEQDQESAKRLLNKMLFDQQDKSLRKQIDKALDKRDRSTFNDLTKRLYQLNNMDENQPF